MAGAGFVDAAALHESLDPVAKVSGAETAAVAAEEQAAFLRQVVEERAGRGKTGTSRAFSFKSQTCYNEIVSGDLKSA